MRTLSADEGNPIGDIIQASKALFKQHDSDSARIVLSKLRNIFGSKAVSTVFTYFCLHGAATGWEIQHELDMPEATAYRALKQLKILGFIMPALKISKVSHSKGGPRPTVWALEGASQEEVARAYHEMRESMREAGE